MSSGKRHSYQSLLNFYNNFHTVSQQHYEKCEKDLKQHIETIIEQRLFTPGIINVPNTIALPNRIDVPNRINIPDMSTESAVWNSVACNRRDQFSSTCANSNNIDNTLADIYKLFDSISKDLVQHLDNNNTDLCVKIKEMTDENEKNINTIHSRISKLSRDIVYVKNDIRRLQDCEAPYRRPQSLFPPPLPPLYRHRGFAGQDRKIPQYRREGVNNRNKNVDNSSGEPKRSENMQPPDKNMSRPFIAMFTTSVFERDREDNTNNMFDEINRVLKQGIIADNKDSSTENKDQKEEPLDETELVELAKHLDTIDSIDNIIDLEKIDESKVERFKINYKFRIMYDCIQPLKELQSMIGLKTLKQDIFKHICYYSNNLHRDEDLNHIVITGPAGVGKTCVAKILGKLYLKMGFLNNNKFNSYKRSDLIGRYLGETAQKTQKAIDDSLGGTMLIDEAYELGNSGKGSEDIYSKECLDTLNRNLSENGNRFLCIIAGYEESIERDIMRQNQGLRRRFGTKFSIDKYSRSELFDIFKSKLKDWTLEDEKYVSDQFNRFDKDVFQFYAADAEVLFKLIRYEYGLRVAKSIKEPDRVIMNKDLDIAYKNMVALREDKHKPPLSMYS